MDMAKNFYLIEIVLLQIMLVLIKHMVLVILRIMQISTWENH